MQNNKRYRILHITQPMYDPSDYIYERDWSGHLLDGYPRPKEGAKPLLTTEQVQMFVQRFNDTKEIAWILHDKDTYTETDEKNDATGRKREGEPKPPHFHILMRSKLRTSSSGNITRSPILTSTISKALGIPIESIDSLQGQNAFQIGLAGLMNATEYGCISGEHRYDRCDVHANFDWWSLADEHAKLSIPFVKGHTFGDWISQLDPNEKDYEYKVWLCAVFYDGMLLKTVKENAPGIYVEHERKFKQNRRYYLSKYAAFPAQRINFLICGDYDDEMRDTALGLAETLYPNLSDSERYYETGPRRSRFKTYDGQPVILWDYVQGQALAKEFTTSYFNSIIDTTPRTSMAKLNPNDPNLINKVNIFYTTQDPEAFLEGLSLGDADRLMQVRRRIPIIVNLSHDEYDIGINKYYLGESNDFDDYEWHRHIKGSADALRMTFGGMRDIYRYFQTKMLSPIRDLAEKALETHIQDTAGFFGEKLNTDIVPPMPSRLGSDAIAKFMAYGMHN